MAILVLDREPLLRRYVRAILETHGFQALEAPDGRTALKEVRSKPDQISLLVTHIGALNGSPGIQLARSVRAEYPHIPVLWATPWKSCRGLCRVAAFLQQPFVLAA